jgi:hypothetical protein
MKRLNDEQKELPKNTRPRIIDNKSLNTDIRQARDINALISIYNRSKHNFDHINICAMLHRFAEIPTNKSNLHVVDLLVPKIKDKIDYFGSRDIAGLLYIFGRLKYRDVELFQILAIRIKAKIYIFTPQDISNILWAFAKLGIRDVELFELLFQEVILRSYDYNAQEITYVLWASATLNIKNDKLIEVLLLDIKIKRHTFNYQNVINILWSLIVLDVYNESIYETFINNLYTNKKLDSNNLLHLYYVYLYCKYEIKSHKMCNLLDRFDFRPALKDNPPISSKFHIDCADHLGSLGVEIENEVSVNRLICDMRIRDTKDIIEFNGPSHYAFQDIEMIGGTILKIRLLKAMNCRVFIIPYWEWNACVTEDEKKNYLLRLLLLG